MSKAWVGEGERCGRGEAGLKAWLKVGVEFKICIKKVTWAPPLDKTMWYCCKKKREVLLFLVRYIVVQKWWMFMCVLCGPFFLFNSHTLLCFVLFI